MFTQCYKCETVFRLSAQALRAAGGQVRCGRCGELFNALARLAEDASSFEHGESAYELETRADEILQSLEVVPPVITSDLSRERDFAKLEMSEPLEIAMDLDPSLEFSLPADDLDRIFIETSPNVLQLLTPPPPAAAAPPAPPAPPPAPPPAAPVAAPPSAATRISGLEVSEDVRMEMLSGYEQAELPLINPTRTRGPRVAWIAGAVALAALLGLQWVVRSTDWLISSGPGDSSAATKLAAYQLRQWGVTGDPALAGTLRVRASILNGTTQPQPYPLLRVTLANRFGARIAQREFEPAAYLGAAPTRNLAGGERVDATLNIIDPGKDAESFEIDVCLPTVGKKIACAGDPAAPVQ